MFESSASLSDPKVSVVIPFYNIGECVSYCLDSLLDQTYDDHEIICIDDGSTDDTATILEKYAATVRNIRLFHKENGGLSAARNYGVEKARGEYISFVDGDDLVSPFYLEALVETQQATGADFVLGTSKRVRYKDATSVEFQKPCSGDRISKHDLIEDLLYERHLPNAWANLAPRSLYVDNPFPVGAYYEEIATIASFVGQSEVVATIKEPIYGYVMRDDSIVHKKKATTKQICDYEAAENLFLSRIDEDSDSSDDAKRYFRALHDTRIFRLLQTVDDEDFRRGRSKRIVQSTRDNLPDLMNDRNVSRGNKTRFALLTAAPALYVRAFDLFDRMRK